MNNRIQIFQIIVTFLVILLNLFSQLVFEELTWLKIVSLGLFIITIGWIIKENRKSLKTRAAAFGLNSFITVLLIVAILGTLNFLAARYPKKLDLTHNKLNTLSDQTEKVVKNLKEPVKAVLFAKGSEREPFRPLLDNLKALNPKFQVEYVDYDKDPIRAKQADLKKPRTLVLSSGSKESKVEEVTEEKVTNALIKLLKEKSLTLCALSGHGEKNISSNEADGYQSVKKGLEDQSYVIKDVLLPQESKIPADCDAVAVLGPTQAFFDSETKVLKEYLANGGRAILAVDVNLKGNEYSPQLIEILKTWYVSVPQGLIVDPTSRLFQVNAAVPVIPSFSREHVITRDFTIQKPSFFPFLRPLEVIGNAPPSLRVEWLAQTTENSFAVMDLKSVAKGVVTFNPTRDKKGPLTAAMAVEGKLADSKATRNTRIVVFGTSQIGTNNYSRFGSNLDFFLNAASWILEDESLISIRAKEDSNSRIEMTEKTANTIFLLTVVVVPVGIFILGIIIWLWRRRL